MDDMQAIERRLEDLKAEHRDLDRKITGLAVDTQFDQLELRRLKKRKLFLKDIILRLESDRHPDIIA